METSADGLCQQLLQLLSIEQRRTREINPEWCVQLRQVFHANLGDPTPVTVWDVFVVDQQRGGSIWSASGYDQSGQHAVTLEGALTRCIAKIRAKMRAEADALAKRQAEEASAMASKMALLYDADVT